VQATTIAFATTGTITDTGGNLVGIRVGDNIEVLGSPLNSRVWKVTGATLASAAVAAVGSIRLDEVPTNADTVTLNGTVITFNTSGSSGDDVDIVAGDAPANATALAAAINASEDAELVKFSASAEGTTVTLTAVTAGTAGNSLTLASSNAAQTVTAMAGGAAAVTTDTLTVIPALVQNESAGAAIEIVRSL